MCASWKAGYVKNQKYEATGKYSRDFKFCIIVVNALIGSIFCHYCSKECLGLVLNGICHGYYEEIISYNLASITLLVPGSILS